MCRLASRLRPSEPIAPISTISERGRHQSRDRRPSLVAGYLADHAAVLKVSTLTRRLAAVSIAHEARDLANPTPAPLVRAIMRGIRREHGADQHQAKPLPREDVFVVLGTMGNRLKDLRDRALLLTGFAGGLRRSELVATNLVDFDRVREGIILTVRRSKTDQDGVGREIGIPWIWLSRVDRQHQDQSCGIFRRRHREPGHLCRTETERRRRRPGGQDSRRQPKLHQRRHTSRRSPPVTLNSVRRATGEDRRTISALRRPPDVPVGHSRVAKLLIFVRKRPRNARASSSISVHFHA
jgi:integrase